MPVSGCVLADKSGIWTKQKYKTSKGVEYMLVAIIPLGCSKILTPLIGIAINYQFIM